MLRVQSKAARAAIMILTLAGFASTTVAPAATDLSNVAWRQPVLPNAYGLPFYGNVFAENSDGYVGASSFQEARDQMNDGVVAYSYSWCYPRSDGGGAWIDLGAEFDIASIEVAPRNGSKWNQLELASVYGSQHQTTDSDYGFIIPDKSSSDARHVEYVNWHNVRWIYLVDESDVYIGVGDDNFLSLSEIRVNAHVQAYNNYVTGVSASATSTYNSIHYYSPDYLVDNRGMTDQHGPVGTPSAKSVGNLGLWMNSNQGTGGFVDQAVTFDLGGTYDLTGIGIWNFNQSTWSTSALSYTDYTTRGVNEALIEYSEDGGETYIALDDKNGEELGNYTIAQAQTDTDGSPKDNGYQLGVGLPHVHADHVRITVKSNHGHSTYAGLSEVRFYGEAVIPDIPGDTNNDGKVDQADAQRLAEYWGATVTPGDRTKGDLNGDGVVNIADASVLAACWTGSGNESGSSTVPEPSTLALLATAIALCAVRRRR